LKQEQFARRRAAAIMRQIKDKPLSESIAIISHALVAALAWRGGEIPDEYAERLTW